MPTVTILLPTYNRAHFLPFAIRSALTQTHKDIRLIILDDASPDRTSAVVEPFLSDPRVQYVRHAQNKGITGNWRFGLENVETEFFCLLEDDDVYCPEFVERLLQPLQDDPDLILTFCDHWAINAAGKVDTGLTESMSRRFGRHSLPSGPIPDFARSALVNGSISITASLFRSAYVSPSFIRDEAGGGIDFWLFYQSLRTGRKAYYVPDRLMEYRLHGAGMSHSMPEMMAKGHLFLYRELLRDPEMASLHRAARRKLHLIGTSYGIHLLLSDRNEEALAHLTEALQNGFSVRAFVARGLAAGKQGRQVAGLLRRAKQRLARSLVPLVHFAAANAGLRHLAKHLGSGTFFRH